MKSKRIAWRNNSTLYAEHMNKLCDLLEDGYGTLFCEILKNYSGISKIVIDELALSSGLLVISYISGIFPDGTNFKYDSIENTYKIAMDLTCFSEELFYSSKKFFIVKDEDIIEEDHHIISEIEEIIPISYSDVKLKITDSIAGNIGFPMAEICIKGGAFQLKEFTPTPIKITKTSTMGNNISKLIIFIRQTVLSLKDQLIINENNHTLRLLLNNINECLVKINMAFINEFCPYDFYLILCECIGKISWNSILMPNIPQYDHSSAYYVIQKLISLLTEIISESRTGYERIEMIREGDVFICNIIELGTGDVFLSIEPNTEDTKNWIENTIIASKSFFEEFQMQRFPGIPRQITDENAGEIIVKLDKFSNYFVIGENLLIFVGKQKNINNISLYFKKTESI